jgi:hypothetical protein
VAAVAVIVLAVAAAYAGLTVIALALSVLALRLGVSARRWLRLAGRAAVGARSLKESQLAAGSGRSPRRRTSPDDANQKGKPRSDSGRRFGQYVSGAAALAACREAHGPRPAHAPNDPAVALRADLVARPAANLTPPREIHAPRKAPELRRFVPRAPLSATAAHGAPTTWRGAFSAGLTCRRWPSTDCRARYFCAWSTGSCRGAYPYETARAKVLDEVTRSEAARWLHELVLLGAGLDSRAYRLAEAPKGVRLFEVDHPASQATKRARLRPLLGDVPPAVRFVAVDFTRDDVASEFARAGHDESARTLFIWSGVSHTSRSRRSKRSFHG